VALLNPVFESWSAYISDTYKFVSNTLELKLRMLPNNAVAELYFYSTHYADVKRDENTKKTVKSTAAGDCCLSSYPLL
jgi:hypothetical protein